ncbi:MAG: hypothetical protein HY848_07140 [Betaproteobacteria bacterium]|nr:hypothetical protein [Betaproteobacteria bacterium]
MKAEDREIARLKAGIAEVTPALQAQGALARRHRRALCIDRNVEGRRRRKRPLKRRASVRNSGLQTRLAAVSWTILKAADLLAYTAR